MQQGVALPGGEADGISVDQDHREHDPAGSDERVVAALAVVGLLWGLGLWFEVESLNGPWYWGWQYRSLALGRTMLLLALPALPVVVVAAWSRSDARRTPWPTLALLTASSIALQLGGALAEPRGLEVVADIVRSPSATSYFSDAERVTSAAELLSGFHLRPLYLHSSTHPPLPILFHRAFIVLLGAERAAFVAGLAIGALASAGVPLMYSFAGLWTPSLRARVVASALYALLPGIVLFLPEFDQVFPLLSMSIAYAWVRALNACPGSRRATVAAVGLGALVFVASLFAYNLLAMGAFLVVYGASVWRSAELSGEVLARITRVTIFALGAFVGLHTLFGAVTGFDPVQSFARALHEQARYSDQLARPYLTALAFDLYDFALASGLLGSALALRRVARDARAPMRDGAAALSVAGLWTVLIIDVTGLLSEAARTWLFLQPLIVVPAALELASLRPRQRLVLLLVLWSLLVVMKCKLWLVRA